MPRRLYGLAEPGGRSRSYLHLIKPLDPGWRRNNGHRISPHHLLILDRHVRIPPMLPTAATMSFCISSGWLNPSHRGPSRNAVRPLSICPP